MPQFIYKIPYNIKIKVKLHINGKIQIQEYIQNLHDCVTL